MIKFPFSSGIRPNGDKVYVGLGRRVLGSGSPTRQDWTQPTARGAITEFFLSDLSERLRKRPEAWKTTSALAIAPLALVFCGISSYSQDATRTVGGCNRRDRGSARAENPLVANGNTKRHRAWPIRAPGTARKRLVPVTKSGAF